MRSPRFQRARQPAQKEERRRAILEAAAQLLAEAGLAAVSLNEIAERVGLAKSNLYRYFDSREEILLELLLADEEQWVEALEQSLAPLGSAAGVEAAVDALVSSVERYPRLCLLTSVVASVLEQNVSHDSVARFKLRVAALSIRIGNALRAALPELPAERIPELLRYLHAVVAGLWPMAHPAPVVAEVLERPELGQFCSDFSRDLRGLLVALFRGLLTTAAPGR
jgi:AcrR family transcriptional regulator